MTQALALIADEVRERVRREGVDVATESELVGRFVSDAVRRYSERALGGSVPQLTDEASATRQIVATLTGFGALQRFLDDESIEEVWVNAPDRVFVARNGVPELTDVRLGESEVRDLVERMLQSSGRRVDLSSPFVDASLPDGSRLHVVIPDVTQRHWAVNIRKFASRIRDLATLVELGSLTGPAAEFLRLCVLSGCNVLVAGATQSGKTTMLNSLLSVAPPTERIVTVEETFELDLAAPDHVAMQCRQPSLEGVGEITLRRLIKEALRMRPDRLIVGEVREAESLDLLIALNSGLPGMSSIHANSARDALVKLCTLPLLAGRNIDSSFVVQAVTSGFTNRYWAHYNFIGVNQVTTSSSTTVQKQDATFKIVPGLADSSCYSFESRNYPGRYLRHYNYVIRLDTLENTATYKADATFCAVAGKTGASGTVSWRSYNIPTRYIRHYGNNLYLAANVGPNSFDAAGSFAADVTWQNVAPWAP